MNNNVETIINELLEVKSPIEKVEGPYKVF